MPIKWAVTWVKRRRAWFAYAGAIGFHRGDFRAFIDLLLVSSLDLGCVGPWGLAGLCGAGAGRARRRAAGRRRKGAACRYRAPEGDGADRIGQPADRWPAQDGRRPAGALAGAGLCHRAREGQHRHGRRHSGGHAQGHGPAQDHAAGPHGHRVWPRGAGHPALQGGGRARVWPRHCRRQGRAGRHRGGFANPQERRLEGL